MEEEIIENEECVISLGKQLANLRQKLGLTQYEIARRIHVKTSIIYEIENDMPVNVPPVFFKGYIKNYASIVGLPEDEYLTLLALQYNKTSTQTMKNYSNKEQKKRNSKRLILSSLFVILVIFGVVMFLAWRESQTDFIEVTHYISQPTLTNS